MEDKKLNRFISAFQAFFFPALFLLYALPCRGRFFYQDDLIGMFNAKISSLETLWKVAAEPLPGTVFYRPVVNLLSSLDWFLWGVNPLPYFLHSIVWQLLSIYLIYKVAQLLTKNKLTAIIAEVLFLFYFPMNSGSISLLTNRSIVMSAVFCLLSFYGFLKMRQETAKNLWWQTVSVFFFGLALFTKESSVPFLLVFMTADLLYFKGQKWLWHIYPAYLLFILSRLLAGFMVKTPLPIGTASSTYSFVLGTNIIANLVYYLGWLLLPAAIILFSLWIVIKISGFKLDMGKAFPPALSIFGLSFAFINTLIYLPFADYRQLGWMQISTIGMAIFLATPTHYMLDLSFSKKSTRKNLVLAGLILIIFLIVISTLFLPSKLVKRNMQSDYAQAFIKDFAALNIGQEKKVYVIDMGSKEYKLIDTFYSPMAGREVLYESLALFLDKKIPKEVHLVENLSGVKAKGNDVVILYYKEKKILRNAP